MAEKHCKKHPDQELVAVTIRYCPVCRGSKGGLQNGQPHDRQGAEEAGAEGHCGSLES